MVRALGILSGDGELFVDLRSVKAGNDIASFAGEDQLAKSSSSSSSSSSHAGQINDDATPSQVIEAMIHAIKHADEQGWKSLFANRRVFTKGDMTIVDSSFTPASIALQR